MEEFFAGMIKMVEERLGPVGRPFTTVIVILCALGLGAWGLNLFVVNAIAPVASFVSKIIGEGTITLSDVRELVGISPAWIVSGFISTWVISRYISRATEKVMSEMEERSAELDTRHAELEEKEAYIRGRLEALNIAEAKSSAATPSEPDRVMPQPSATS